MKKIKPQYRLIAVAILGLGGLGLAVAWTLSALGQPETVVELHSEPVETVVVNQVLPVLTEEKTPPVVQPLNPPNLFQNVAPEAAPRSPQPAPTPTSIPAAPVVQTVVRYEPVPVIPNPIPSPPNTPVATPAAPTPVAPPPPAPPPKPEPLQLWVEEVQLSIISTSLGEVGSVSISTNRGQATFSEGDEIEDGVIIKRIFHNRIVLEKSGRVLEVR